MTDEAEKTVEPPAILSAAETCKLRTWCVERDGHTPPCVEVLRAPHEAPTFGPRSRR